MLLNDFEMTAFSKGTEKLKKQCKLFIWPATLYLMSSVPACQNISVPHPTTVSQLCKNTVHVEYQYQKFCVYLKLILTLRRLMSYIYGAPILDVSRSHTTTQHSR